MVRIKRRVMPAAAVAAAVAAGALAGCQPTPPSPPQPPPPVSIAESPASHAARLSPILLTPLDDPEGAGTARSGAGSWGRYIGTRNLVDGPPGTTGASKLDGCGRVGFEHGPSVAPTGAFSLGAWVKPDSPTSTRKHEVFRNRWFGFTLQYGATWIGVAFHDDQRSLGDKSTRVSVPAGTFDRWRHVAATVGPAGTTIYLDGAPVGSSTKGIVGSVYYEPGGGVAIGQDGDACGGAPQSISTFALFDRVLSGAEVSRLAKASPTKVAYEVAFNFSETSVGSTVIGRVRVPADKAKGSAYIEVSAAPWFGTESPTTKERWFEAGLIGAIPVTYQASSGQYAGTLSRLLDPCFVGTWRLRIERPDGVTARTLPQPYRGQSCANDLRTTGLEQYTQFNAMLRGRTGAAADIGSTVYSGRTTGTIGAIARVTRNGRTTRYAVTAGHVMKNNDQELTKPILWTAPDRFRYLSVAGPKYGLSRSLWNGGDGQDVAFAALAPWAIPPSNRVLVDKVDGKFTAIPMGGPAPDSFFPEAVASGRPTLNTGYACGFEGDGIPNGAFLDSSVSQGDVFEGIPLVQGLNGNTYGVKAPLGGGCSGGPAFFLQPDQSARLVGLTNAQVGGGLGLPWVGYLAYPIGRARAEILAITGGTLAWGV